MFAVLNKTLSFFSPKNLNFLIIPFFTKCHQIIYFFSVNAVSANNDLF